MLRRLALSLFLLLVAPPFAPNGARAAATLDDIMARGELVVAVYRDFPPFSFHTGGEVAGVDVDLARALAKRLGLKAAIMEVTAGETVDDDLRNAVWKGHYLDHKTADVMVHVPTDRVFMLRNTNAVIFAPYFRERVVVARNPEKVIKSDDISIFEQEKVAWSWRPWPTST
jgi:ABC-type amino acid transport substrate-binding protein